MARFLQYRHSGRLGVGLPLGLVAGAFTAVAGAWLYQRFVIWVPFIYITFLGTLGFGAAIGLAVGFTMRAGKTRSLLAPVVIGGLCGVLGDAASFHFDYQYRLAEAAEELSASGEVEGPVTAELLAEMIPFSTYIELKAEEGFSVGSSSSGGIPLQGVLVYIIWLIELGVIAGTALVLARKQLTDAFCERCAQWMQARELGMRMGVEPDSMRRAARDGDLAPLLAPQPDPESTIRAGYSVHECTRCREEPYLTVSLVRTEVNKKGEPEDKIDVIARQVAVSPDEVAALARDLGHPAPAGS